MQGLLSPLAFHTNLFSARAKPCGDGLVFRLHYRVTFALLMACCLLVTATQYIGAPISCLSDDSLPQNVINTYCYIASTFTLPSSTALRHGWKAAQRRRVVPGSGPEERRYHNYYMWVPYMLFLQSVSFYLPHWIWKVAQTDKVRGILQGLNYVVVDDEQRRMKEALMVNYLVFHWGSHTAWAFKYVLCETLNLLNTVLQLVVTDSFLGGQFLGYGPRVVQYLRHGAEEDDDPMNQVFPRLTKCTFYRFGAGGSLERFDALCVLSINVVNDKIYLTVWFWYIVLIALGSLLFVYRLATVFSPKLRRRLLLARGSRYGADPAIDDVTRKCGYGDWYLLRTLSRNMSAPVFSSVVRQLAVQLPRTRTTMVEVKV
ncbi:innexin inx2-like isoform X2 [Amphibalanus amphitrite]|nr:innexin inx2-like isoform X2 [Amphibalanus amphitrite]